MTSTKTYTFLLVTMFVTILALLTFSMAKGGATSVAQPVSVNRFVSYSFFATSTTDTFAATTTTATSTNIAGGFDSNGIYDDGSLDIRGAKSVNVTFGRGDTRGNGNSGSTVFKVEVYDGTQWVWFKELRELNATSTANMNRLATVSLSGTTTAMYSLATLGWQKMRCVVLETTDGEHKCVAAATF